MKEEDFNQLENLLGKLQTHIGHRYCIIPCYIADGCSIGIYDNYGNIIRQAIGFSLEDAVSKIVVQTLNT